jgi:hypothetical protein
MSPYVRGDVVSHSTVGTRDRHDSNSLRQQISDQSVAGKIERRRDLHQILQILLLSRIIDLPKLVSINSSPHRVPGPSRYLLVG